MAKIFALGPRGSYGHEVAEIVQERLRLESEVTFQATNVGVLQATEQGTGFGIIPVENSSQGDVVDVLGYLAKQSKDYPLHIIGQVELPIRHSLWVPWSIHSVAELEGLATHPQASGQCKKCISRWKISRIEPTNSTAAAAKFVAENPGKKMGAIASSRAGKEYNLKELERDVHDLEDNTTRFFVFGSKQIIAPKSTGKDKSVIIFQVRNMPGSLWLSLLPFFLCGINMTSIHSVSQGGWQYRFYAETNGHAKDLRMRLALSGMKLFLKDLFILGTFPVV